ncbi:hypothetical protein ANO11243_008030 [Dothideomycetidae sp. 11243]|nr:hypothetical protein ANO11243_008030 [fungal sp. No.11243]
MAVGRKLVGADLQHDRFRDTHGGEVEAVWLLRLSSGLRISSILVFARRLFTPEAKGARSALRYAILFMIVWSIVCPVFLGAGCHPGNLLLAERDMVCTAQVFRMTFAAGVECLTELLVVAMPIYLTLTRDIKREYKTMAPNSISQLIVSHRILPLGIVYFMSYAWMANSGKNNIGIVPNMILQEMLVCWSLILATTPTLRAFAGRFKTGGLRDILAPERARRQSDVGMATKAAAVIALRSMAVQIRGIAAFSIFDHSKRPDTRNHHTPVRPDIENRHWANIFIRPEDVRSSDESSINDRVPYSQYDMQPREGWEKKRAEQLLSMPHRASLSSIHFVTTAEDYMEEKSE